MPYRLTRPSLLCTLLAISACQTPAILQSPEPSALLPALQQLENQQYQTAETEFQTALKTDNELLKQQALAGLCLVHLQNQDINAATSALDELYLRALRKPQSDSSLRMLRLSLTLSVESAMHLATENQARLAAEAKQLQLRSEAQALQQALEKLRQLSLQ